MITLTHIVACSANGIIGRNGELPWHLPSDLKFFKQVTTGHTIIMGRKTFESIGKALPKRLSIVITRQNPELPEGVLKAESLDEAFAIAEKESEKWGSEVFVIGGGEIYRQTLGLVNKVFLTKIHHEIEGDTTYPLEDLEENFELVSEEVHMEPEHYSFMTLKRKDDS